MTPLKILSVKEKNEVLKKLNQQFGVEEISGLLLMKGAEKIFFYSGKLGVKEIFELEKTVPVEKVGVYFAKFEPNGIRLSMEGVNLLKDQIKKNIFEINDEQAEKWMQGSELNIETGMKGFVVMKCGNDFLGCGKASEKKIGNFIPKNRRLKSKTIIQ